GLGEDVPAAGGPDAERDRDRIVGLVADRHRDPDHPQLPRAGLGPAVEADRRVARREALDLDLLPADAPDAEPQDLAHGLLRRPPPGERLGPIADVTLVAQRTHAPPRTPTT